MEDVTIREFLSIDHGPGYGTGSGSGSGSGFGSGFGSGDSYGPGCGYGSGCGDGFGSGSGGGSGSGDGYGYGTVGGYGDGYCTVGGSGYGYGTVGGPGSGSGSGDGIQSFCGQTVYSVDGVPTLIDHIRGNVAKGRVLKGDLTTESCWIVRQNNLFAHGATLRQAQAALRDKLFEDMSEDERIEAFMAGHEPGRPYPNRELYDWHCRLTGSCELGRRTFVENCGLSLDGESTVEEFIGLTRNAYGGEVIRKLEERYEGRKRNERCNEIPRV